MPRRRATSSHCTACWMPSIARPTKGATCSCDEPDPAGRDPRRVGRRSPRCQLSSVPTPSLERSRRRAGGRPAAPVRRRARSARRVALGVLVRLRDPGRRAVLAGGRAVALHAAVGTRLPRHHRDLRSVVRPDVPVRRRTAGATAAGSAVGRVPRGLDHGRMVRRPPGGHPLSLAWAGHVARRCARAGAVGRPRGRPGGDPVAGVVQRDARRSATREPGAGSGTLRWRPAAAMLASIVCAGAYGVWRERTLPIRELGTVGLIQPNEGFREKWDPRHADSVVAKLVTMSRALEARGPLDLVLWPEAAIPGWLAEMPGWDAKFAALAREGRIPILTGGIHAVSADVYYNAAFFYDSTGQWRPYPVYGKHYLVPVVERVPFVPVRLFRSVPGLRQWSGGFSPGPTLPLYETKMARFGVVICYESAFDELARAYRRAGAHFLVNITNDAWYGRTAGPYQHASHLVLRAIETRTGIARAANDGISEFVDPLGQTYAATGLEVEATVADRLRTSDVITPYVRLGDWVGTLCVLATLGFAGAMAVLHWRRNA